MPDNQSIDVTVTADQSKTGKISGSGKMDIVIDDATKFGLDMDYKDPDHVDLMISGKHTFKVGDGDLDISGDISDNVVNGSITVEGTSKISISKDVAASISTQFNSKEGASGSATISISL
jgi:hypothetical protein